MATDLGQLIFTLTLVDEGFAEQVGAASAGMDTLGGSADKTAAQMDVAGASTAGAGADAADASGGFDLLSGSMLKSFAPLIALFAGYEGIKAVLNDTRVNTDLWNSSALQINNTLKNTSDAVGINVDGLEKMADANSKGLPITAAANLAAENTLLNYNQIGKTVYPAVAAQVDNVATAMANLSGRTIANSDDVATAAKKLGVAMQDPATGVTRLKLAGIDFSASQIDAIKTMEKTNGVTAAQTLLLSDLADVVGGKAQTSTQTFAGQLEMVRKQLDTQLEPAIKNIEKALEKFGEEVLAVVLFLEKHRKGVEDIISVLLPLAAGIGVVILAMKAWEIATNAVKAAQIALEAVMDFNPVILAIMAVVAVALLVVTHWNDVKQWFSDFIDWITSHWQLLVDILFGPFGIVVTQIIDHWQSILSFFENLPGNILKAIGSLGSLLYSAGQSIIQGLINGLESMVDSITQKITDVTNGIKNVAKKVLGIFSPSTVFADIGQNVTLGLAQGISSNADTAVKATSDLTAGVVGAGMATPSPSNNNSTNAPINYNFAAGSVVLSTAEAVDEFYNIGNRNIQLELNGGSPLAGTAGV